MMSDPKHRNPGFLMDGSLGSWGSFDQRVLHEIEMIWFVEGSRDVGGYLRVVREQTEKIEAGTPSKAGSE